MKEIQEGKNTSMTTVHSLTTHIYNHACYIQCPDVHIDDIQCRQCTFYRLTDRQ